MTSGSRIAVRGIMRGWKMIFLVWVASSVITPARPTSLPVPAVVGMATIGRDALGARPLPPVADILEVPQGPVLAGHEGDDLAAVQRTAAAQRHHAVMAAGGKARTPGLDIAGHRVRAHVGEQAGLAARRRAGSRAAPRSPAARRARGRSPPAAGRCPACSQARAHLGEAAGPVDHRGRDSSRWSRAWRRRAAA